MAISDTLSKNAPPQAGKGRGKGITLAVIAATQLMVVLDATIVNIALPHIKDALNFSTTDLSWVINAYTLTFGGLLLLGGRAGDILGRRRVFIFGTLLFGLASLLGGFAQDSSLLLAARALQGIGGAICSPTAFALIATNFEEGRNATRRSASSRRWPDRVPRSACWPAVCSPSTWTGAGCSSSTCRSRS